MKQYLKFDLTPSSPALIYYPNGKEDNAAKEPSECYKINLPKAVSPDAKTKAVNCVQFSANPDSGISLTNTSKYSIQRYKNSKIIGKPLTSLTIPLDVLSAKLNNTTMENGGQSGFIFTRYNKSKRKYQIEACIGLHLPTENSDTKYALTHSRLIDKTQIPKGYKYKQEDISNVASVLAGVSALTGGALFSTATHPIYTLGKGFLFLLTAGMGDIGYKGIGENRRK